MAIKSLSIRIDDEMLDKLHYVADYEARSANGQIIVLIRECIEKFEEKHGKIVLGDEPGNANSSKNCPMQSPKGQSKHTAEQHRFPTACTRQSRCGDFSAMRGSAFRTSA